jgi:hypothetical protein
MALGTAGMACEKASGADAVKAYQSVADAVCACKDMTCVEKAGAEGGKAAEKYKSVKLSDAEKAAVKQAGERMAECTNKLAAPPEAVPPATPPPAEAAAPDAG